MNRSILFLLVFFCLLCAAAVPAAADEDMKNPSLYSAAGMVYDLQTFWPANTVAIREYMKNYPDFTCELYSNTGEEMFDDLICSSVNNAYARDVIINFYFTGDHAGMTGLQEAVFTLGVKEPADLQEILEKFWYPEAFPWHTDNDQFYLTMHSLIFYTRTTVQRFDLPDFNTSGDHFVTVDFWDSSASRLAVG